MGNQRPSASELTTNPQMGERALIAAIRARAGRASGGVRLGIGDDCAILRPPAGHEIAVTTDLSLEGVHFRRDWHSPESVGHRCLARGLSDLAAMGAKPLAAFLSIALPPELTLKAKGGSWLDRFLDGMLALANDAGVPLAGGDTAQSPAVKGLARDGTGLVTADIVLLGTVKAGRALLRSRAQVGDVIYVSGALGGAAAELLAISRNPTSQMRDAGRPHLFPAPRLQVGYRLGALRGVHAAIDLSDGLSTDLAHICEESGVAAEIDAAAIPVHPLAVEAERDGRAVSALELALHGGEDYELLFTAQVGVRVPGRISSLPVSAIGRVVARKKGRALLTLRDANGGSTALRSQGWEHFAIR